MKGQTRFESTIEDKQLKGTQLEPIVELLSDPQAHLYYRFYMGTRVGDKFLCVVVKVRETAAFVLTAYLTDKIKKGVRLWPNET
jgi:hypothetical protein